MFIVSLFPLYNKCCFLLVHLLQDLFPGGFILPIKCSLGLVQQSVSICRNLYPIPGTTNLQHCKSSLCIYSRVLCFSGRKRRWARIKVCLYQMVTSQNFRFIRHRSALAHLNLQLRKSTPRAAVCCVFHLTHHRGKTRSQVS